MIYQPKHNVILAISQPWAQLIVNGVIDTLPFDKEFIDDDTRIFIAARPFEEKNFQYTEKPSWIERALNDALGAGFIEDYKLLEVDKVLGYVDTYTLSLTKKRMIWEGIGELDSLQKVRVFSPHLFSKPIDFAAITDYRGYMDSPDDFAVEVESAQHPRMLYRAHTTLHVPMADYLLDAYNENYWRTPLYMNLTEDSIHLYGEIEEGNFIPHDTKFIVLKSPEREFTYEVEGIETDVLLDKNSNPVLAETPKGEKHPIPRIKYKLKPLFGNKMMKFDEYSQIVIQWMINNGYEFTFDYNDRGDTVFKIKDFNIPKGLFSGEITVDDEGYSVDMDIVWEHGLENLTNEDILFTLNFVNSQPEHFVYFSLDEENDKIFVHCHQITKDGFSKETLDLMFWSFALRSAMVVGLLRRDDREREKPDEGI